MRCRWKREAAKAGRGPERERERESERKTTGRGAHASAGGKKKEVAPAEVRELEDYHTNNESDQ
jgi:hypothetical protein